jgi:hypothetical protein
MTYQELKDDPIQLAETIMDLPQESGIPTLLYQIWENQDADLLLELVNQKFEERCRYLADPDTHKL